MEFLDGIKSHISTSRDTTSHTFYLFANTFEHIFIYNAEKSNLILLDKTFNKNIYIGQMRVSFSRKILSCILFLFSLLLSKRNNEGEINVYLLEKSN